MSDRTGGPEHCPSPSPFTGEGGARPRSGWEGEGISPSPKELLARAGWMRTHPTEAEKRLWTILRDRRLAVFKFRRQQIITPYIVDFICLDRRLIVEADGSQHADNKDDARREGFLRRQDFRLLRFWNNHIIGETEAVATAILAALSVPHPPKPSAWAPPSPVKGEGSGASNA
jgi:very-short-patch-repair endonuclease